MSLLTYNGIQLPYGHTTQFFQEAVTDESGTDWYCTRFTIRVQTIVNPNYITSLVPDEADREILGDSLNDPAMIMNLIRSQLLRKRRRLSFVVNGVEMIPQVDANVGTVDVRNGPDPKSCNIFTLTADTFLVDYLIVAHYWENIALGAGGTINVQGNRVLYNRWSETADIDNCCLTTLTREGKYVIRSDHPESLLADRNRDGMCPVAVRPGFLRVSSHYTVAPDGLAVQYRVVDREVFKRPPEPAYEATGTYIETTTKLGHIRHGEARVRLKGASFVPQLTLVQTAVAVASNKILDRDPFIVAVNTPFGAARRFAQLEMAVVKVNMYENEVECYLRSRLQPIARTRNNGVAGLAVNGTLVSTPGTTVGAAIAPSYPMRGSAGILLRAAAYFDPSLANTVLDQNTRQLSNGLEVGTAGATVEV